MKIKPLEFIKIAWVVEVAVLILYGLFVLPWLKEYSATFLDLLPLYASLIAAQGLIAAGAPRLKQIQDNQKLIITTNGGEK